MFHGCNLKEHFGSAGIGEQGISQLLVPRIAETVNQSSNLCSVDLKLGMESSCSGPSKKAKLPTSGSGQQVPVCLVDGCISDLGECRDYHRRHKVCELHSKTARVFVKGREQRFCQQCSRFHSLGEFDEGKRSCRKRLDGHNRRRRKPQHPDPLSLSSARLFCDHQGTRYLQFGSSQVFATSAATSAWAETVKAENDSMLYSSSSNQSTLDFINNKRLVHPAALSQHNYRGKQFPFSQGTTSSPVPGDSPGSCQQGFQVNPTLGSHGSSHKMFSSNGTNHVIDSDRALSLLSSLPPLCEATPEIGSSHVVHLPGPGAAQSSMPTNLRYLGMKTEPIGSVLVSNNSSHDVSSGLHHQNQGGLFQIGPDDGSSGSGSRDHTLSFSFQ